MSYLQFLKEGECLLKRKAGLFLVFIFALSLSLMTVSAGAPYYLMEVREEQSDESVTLISKIPRLSGMDNEVEQAKRNAEFREESKRAMILSRMYQAKSGEQTVSANQDYLVSLSNQNYLSVVIQTEITGAHSSTHLKQGYTICLSDAKPLFFSDLFEQDSQYEQVVENRIREEIQDPDFQLCTRQPYYLTTDAVVVLVGSFSDFSQKEVVLPKEQLEGLLKPIL